jgi:uncharacterized protein (DUF1330 family)
MPVYLIVNVHIKDRAAFEGYARNVPPIVRKFGGEYLAASDAPEVIEGNWRPHRLVLVRFPDMRTAKSFLNAVEYAPWKALRQQVTHSEMVALEGLR